MSTTLRPMAVYRVTRERVALLQDRLGPGPWSVAALVALGWSRHQVDAGVRGGILVRVRRGIVALPGSGPTLGLEGLRVLLSGLSGRAVVSHSTAASPQGLWTPGRPDPLIHVTIPGAAERTDAGVRVHGCRLPAAFVHHVDGVPLTTPARTAVDLARGRPFPDALVAIDGAARAMTLAAGVDLWSIRGREIPADVMGRVRDELNDACGSVWGWPGSRVVRSALDVWDVAAESAFESWSRGWILMGSLPTPQINVAVLGASGREYVGDFVWRRHRVIGEADGVAKYGLDAATQRSRLRRQREREDDLSAAGWRTVRWVTGEPGRVLVSRVARELGVTARVTA